ncbi:MAG: hypothetical protein R2780_00445 [Crocinitomicaceae bacterium]|nr:hypothetical protein [Crocinitomicaceae bacterium]
MHKGRITIAVLAGIGVLCSIMPWRVIEIPYMGIPGLGDNLNGLIQMGTDVKLGFVTITLFLVIGLLALVGKKDKMIAKGFPKMGVLIISGLLVLFHLIVAVAFTINDFQSPAWGLYLAAIVSLLTMGVPFLFKSDGSLTVPTSKEIEKEIEVNADIIEDQVEKIEAKIEDKFDKDKEEEK